MTGQLPSREALIGGVAATDAGEPYDARIVPIAGS